MTSCNPVSHIIDSRFYADAYSTPESKRIFCDLYRYQRWLDVEAALASAQAELGIIPQAAASDINARADIRQLDLAAVKKGLKVSNHSLIPLLQALAQVCASNTTGFIHYGATTQDIQDTAQVLEIRDALQIIYRDLLIIIRRVAELAEKNSDLVFIGRTHTQVALPMTLGLKMAVWLDELYRNHQRLKEMEKRLLVSQLFGGVGTMDSFGHHAFQLLKIFSRKLDLSLAITAWHSSRDRFAEFLSVLALLSGTLAKIADEIRGLARSEIGEMEEPFHPGKIGSSTMPHKRNPEMCEQVVVLAKLVKANSLLGMDGLLNEHERDYRSVRLEWATIADSVQYVCSSLSLMKLILENLIIHRARISSNVKRAAPVISTEALMFCLGKNLGKDRAHTLIYNATMEAAETDRDFLDILFEQSEISDFYSQRELEQVLDPSKHTGMSRMITDNVLQHVRDNLDFNEMEPGNERQCPLASSDGSCPVV